MVCDMAYHLSLFGSQRPGTFKCELVQTTESQTFWPVSLEITKSSAIFNSCCSASAMGVKNKQTNISFDLGLTIMCLVVACCGKYTEMSWHLTSR